MKTPRLRKAGWALLPALALAAAGCATQDPYKGLRLTGDPLLDGPAAIQSGPPRDRVLWDYRMAAAAMRRDRFDEAQQRLEDALPRIGGIIANDKDARKARSAFYGEARKTFIGEPYERVMAYYYRGILYWMRGEPDNARACFRSAQFMDADVENRQYSSDYVLLDYLDGLVTAKLGGNGADELKRARANAKNSLPPPFHPQANVIVFIEFGRAPEKYATGAYQQELRFRPGPATARSAALQLGPQQFVLVPYDDLFFQASTRGGRAMDHILANKAVFKTGTDALGNAALVSGVALAAADNPEAGAIVAGVGLLSKIISAATVPAADVRAWDNLPQYLSFAALVLPPGPQQFRVDFRDGGGRVLSSKNVSFTVLPAPRDTVLFVSELN